MKDGHLNRLSFQVPRTRVELAHPFGYYTLNVARLPFRHLGYLTLTMLSHHPFLLFASIKERNRSYFLLRIEVSEK